jgi:ankyrin repeat protein
MFLYGAFSINIMAKGMNFKERENELMKAIKKGKEHKIPQLLEKCNINTETKEGTPLTLSIDKEMFSVAKSFIRRGANVMALDGKRRNALMLCILKNNQELFNQIIFQKNDFNHKDIFGSTCLMYACLKKNPYFIEKLIAQELELNVKNKEGNTALIIASIVNSYEGVKLLLEKRALVNEKNSLGKTSLMYSAGNGNLRMFELLLNNKAKIYDKDNVGYSVLDHAVLNGSLNVVERILNKGVFEVKENIISEIPLQFKNKTRKIFEEFEIIL